MLQEIMNNEELDDLTMFVKKCGFDKYPNEACGLIYSDKIGRPKFVECKNVSLEPRHKFLIDPEEYLKVSNLGTVVGCWHTHCNISSDPSESDKQGCKTTQVPWFIGAVHGDVVPQSFEGLTLVKDVENYEAPLVGRVYTFGVFDCFSLMRDFYHREMKIELPDLPRTERIWTTEKDYMENKAKNVFDLVRLKEDQTPEKGDLFFVQTGLDGADHICIYLGDDKILHQMRNRLSRVDIYGGSYWQEHTLSCWRHKSRCLQK